MNTTEDISLSITRFIKATPERVFTAWTSPDDIMRWWGPGTCHALSAEIDARVGGAFTIKMTTQAGNATIKGVYREVTPPSHLVFTWTWADNPEMSEVETLVTVQIEKAQGGTHVVVTHQGFPSEEERANHEYGWSGALDKLVQSIEAMQECRTPGHFSWNELHAKDLDVATTFYTKLLGWEAVPMPGGAPYTLFKSGNTMVGGMMEAPYKDAPSMWLAYITVADVDASTSTAESLGAKIIAPPKDIPGVGRIAIVQDPQGAVIGLFQPLA